jgi:CRP/FNR family transcriptional regulator, cyclic AMP receptor protein
LSAAEPVDIPLLAVLSKKDREAVLSASRQRTFTPGQVLVREGESAVHLFVILAGHARVELGGREVGRLAPGDFFGELALIEEHERTATVTAEDEVRCLVIPAWEFRSLLKEHPALAMPMLEALIKRLHRREHHPF